jgi:hypothetical protein
MTDTLRGVPGRPPLPWSNASTSRRADMPVAEGELDADLARLVRRTSVIRQGFYVVVLLVALAGQVSGAVEALGIPIAAALPAVAALELGGIVVLANADVRRRLGERAVASRLLSVAIATGAVSFNWLAHKNHLLGGFFAGMSALGYLVWLMHTENQRRDRLRIKGDLPPTTPAYEVAGHWIRHPWLTLRARALAKADPRLGLYDSLATARADIRRERRQAAIAKVLHRKIRSAVDPRTADIAIAVYDLDEIAARLAAQADYDGLTALIAADLAPARLAPDGSLAERPPARRGRKATPSQTRVPAQPMSRDLDALAPTVDPMVEVTRSVPVDGRPRRPGIVTPPGPVAFRDPGLLAEVGDEEPDAVEPPTVTATNGHTAHNGRHSVPAQGDLIQVNRPARRNNGTSDAAAANLRARRATEPAARPPAPPGSPPTPPSSLFTDLRRDLSHLQPARLPARPTPPADEQPADDHLADDHLADDHLADDHLAETDPVTVEASSLRRRVHRALDATVVPGDQRDDTELLALVYDELGLSDLERLSAQSYVRSWLLEMRTGERIRTA